MRQARTKKVLVVPVDGPVRTMDWTGDLTSLQVAVALREHGGAGFTSASYACTVARRKVKVGGRQATCWCDEDGRARKLRVNLRASRIAGEPVFGPVVLVAHHCKLDPSVVPALVVVSA